MVRFVFAAAAFVVVMLDWAKVSNPVVAQSAVTAFDGNWSGTMTTTRGNRCSRSYFFKLEVSGGRIAGLMEGNVSNYRFSGTIAPDNTAKDMKAVGSQLTVNFEGGFDGDTAAGDWRSDQGNCRGTFKAKRKTAG